MKAEVAIARERQTAADKNSLRLEMEKETAARARFQARMEEYKGKLETMQMEHHALERSHVELVEKARFESDQLEVFRARNADAMQRLKALEDLYETQKVHLQEVEAAQIVIKKDYEDSITTLKDVNHERNRLQDELWTQKNKANDLRNELQDKDELMARERKYITKLKGKLERAEIAADALGVQRATIKEEAEIDKKLLYQRIGELTEKVDRESYNRDNWMKKYEDEYKGHLETAAALNQMKIQSADQNHELEEARYALKNAEKQEQKLEGGQNELQEQVNELLREKESISRENATQHRLIDTMEKQHREYIARLRREYLTVESKVLSKVDQKEMECEDLLSHLRELQERVTRLHAKAAVDESFMKRTKESLQRAEDNVSLRDREKVLLEEQMLKMQDQLLDAEAAAHRSRLENERNKSDLESLNEETDRLRSQLIEKTFLLEDFEAIKEKLNETERILDLQAQRMEAEV